MYSVSIYSSKLGLPLFFVVHTYVVTEYNGTKNRYDLFAPYFSPIELAYNGNIFKNLIPPKLGFLLFYRAATWGKVESKGLRWKAKCHNTVTGEVGSPAHKLYSVIEGAKLEAYPYMKEYQLVKGPNSNTFTQWIIDQVPETGLKLPWNAWGKGYRK